MELQSDPTGEDAGPDLMSPPAPPPCFNPPAESPPDPAFAVSPPPSDPNSPTPTASFARELLFPAEGSLPRRPDLRAVQRVSDEAILSSPGSHGSTGSPLGSEGGDHLQEMRERLMSESSSAEGSRRGSETDMPTFQHGFDLHIISPTPPLQPSTEEAGPSRKRSLPPEPSDPHGIEHAWDSVWPASGFTARPAVATVELPPFVPAPVSPFVTPTFSTPKPLRRPSSPVFNTTSPPARRSPRGSGTFADSARDLQRLQTDLNSGRSPPKGKHNRSASGSASALVSNNRSIPENKLSFLSPPQSPDRPSIPLEARPGSPIGVTWRKTASGSNWRETLGSSPPSASPLNTRPRRFSHSAARPPSPPPLDPSNSRRGGSPLPAPVPISALPPLESQSSFSLPPAITSPPNVSGDDGMATLISPPPAPPLARPAALRRALSDYDAKTRSAHPALHRTQSITAELEKSPKRTTENADIQPPNSPGSGEDSDVTRIRKSPRRSPGSVPSTLPVPDTPMHESVFDDAGPGESDFLDEGDVLPTGDYQMDVTFDDEGLNTLERIFLLSKSDFGFHRSYVARVLGDLLDDVDPCESVEYVLPLLSGFSVDDDDSVKEAFAEQLHRVLWYFYSTCRLVDEVTENVTVTSEGISVMPTPPVTEVIDAPVGARRRSVTSPGPSSDGSNLSSLSQQTSSFYDSTSKDNSSMTSVTSERTAFSPPVWVNAHADGSSKPPAELIIQPELPINFFTPLLGSLLLNQNAQVSVFVRDGLVAVLERLRGKVDEEKWGKPDGDVDERRTFHSQEGPHAHDLRPFTQEAKWRVENELLSSIVLGMGRLSTDMPDMLFDLEEGNRAMEQYGSGEAPSRSQEAEAFQLQLVQEAQAGRATTLILIGALCAVYPGQEVVDRGFLDEVLRSTDGDETVRTEGAVALSYLAKTIPAEHIDHLLPIFEILAHDEVENVRSAVAVSLPGLVRLIPSTEYKRAFAVEGITSLHRAGDACRCATLEILGELVYIFHDDPQGPPEELLSIFKDDTDEYEVYPGDCEWDIVASFNFPGVCLTIGPDRWSEIRDLLARLQDRAGERVLTTIASFIHELAKILHPPQVAEDLLPIYTRCLDESDEIRERVYEHVDIFIAGLPSDLAWSAYLGLAEAWKTNTLGGWRAREAVALHIPAFLTLFADRDVTPILEMTRSALLDKFAAVRDAATSAVPNAYETLLPTNHAKPFREMLLDFSTASHYRQRLTFTRCLREFVKPPPNRQTFEEFFLPALPRLSQDVVDVRLAIAQIIADLFVIGAYYASATAVPNEIMVLAEGLGVDESADVRDTIRKVDLDSLVKGKGVPHSVDAPRPSQSNNALLPEGMRPDPIRRPSMEVTGKMGGLGLTEHREQSSPSADGSSGAEVGETPMPDTNTRGGRGREKVEPGGSKDVFASSFRAATDAEDGD